MSAQIISLADHPGYRQSLEMQPKKLTENTLLTLQGKALTKK
jgi:hypothetical protein